MTQVLLAIDDESYDELRLYLLDDELADLALAAHGLYEYNSDSEEEKPLMDLKYALREADISPLNLFLPRSRWWFVVLTLSMTRMIVKKMGPIGPIFFCPAQNFFS